MTSSEIDTLIPRLQTCNTPTVCNALEIGEERRGLDGAVTNSDPGDMPNGLRVLEGEVGPVDGFVTARDFRTPSYIFGMTVNEDDPIHADLHFAVCVPRNAIAQSKTALSDFLAAKASVHDLLKECSVYFKASQDPWARFERAYT